MKLFGKLANILGLKKKEVKVLILGLNNSGKSTLVNNLKSDEDKVFNIVPTVGLNIEKFKCKLSHFYHCYLDNLVTKFDSLHYPGWTVMRQTNSPPQTFT